MMEVVNNTIATKQASLEEWERNLDQKQQEIEELKNEGYDNETINE